LPAATTAGGPNPAQGSAKSAVSSNGSAHASSVVPAPHASGNGNGNGHAGPVQAAKRNGSPASAAAKDRVAVAVASEPSTSTLSRSEQFASFQTDAPSCDNCGAITVRNGNCYLCHNCGNSMGCS
jgi:ribonucleoside-diphosphate reductase alpha chain